MLSIIGPCKNNCLSITTCNYGKNVVPNIIGYHAIHNSLKLFFDHLIVGEI